jgi:solute carrier family 35 protein E2
MTLVGIMRGTTVILGLVSLSHVAVSFTETIKASAPIFTVAFAYVILGEKTPWQLALTLIPVMGGLVLCSATELSFDTIGFFAAVFNNIIDCVQNVFSKKLLSGGMSPTGLQFYTSVAAATIQLPILIYKLIPHLLDTSATPMTSRMMWMLFFDGCSYHMQSITAYYTMSLLSPVSQSVANTVKRAALIVLSILYFSNSVTTYNMLGVTIVVSFICALDPSLSFFARRLEIAFAFADFKAPTSPLVLAHRFLESSRTTTRNANLSNCDSVQ